MSAYARQMGFALGLIVLAVISLTVGVVQHGGWLGGSDSEEGLNWLFINGCIGIAAGIFLFIKAATAGS